MKPLNQHLVLLPFGFLIFMSGSFCCVGISKFQRFLSVPNFHLGIASGYVGAFTHKSGEKLNIQLIADPNHRNWKIPSHHNLDIL